MKHSLPWRVVENSWSDTTVVDADDRTICKLSIYGIATEDTQEILEKEMDDRSRFIVRACNSHDELLSLIEACFEWIDAVPQDTVLPAMPGLDREWACWVIARAKGKGGDECP